MCFKAVSEALFEDLCHRKLQFASNDEDLWVEKEITFSPDAAPSSRYSTIVVSSLLPAVLLHDIDLALV